MRTGMGLDRGELTDGSDTRAARTLDRAVHREAPVRTVLHDRTRHNRAGRSRPRPEHLCWRPQLPYADPGDPHAGPRDRTWPLAEVHRGVAAAEGVQLGRCHHMSRCPSARARPLQWASAQAAGHAGVRLAGDVVSTRYASRAAKRSRRTTGRETVPSSVARRREARISRCRSAFPLQIQQSRRWDATSRDLRASSSPSTKVSIDARSRRCRSMFTGGKPGGDQFRFRRRGHCTASDGRVLPERSRALDAAGELRASLRS